MAAVNIFAGDLLFKNFGVTRYGRIVFYDYDEIEYLTDVLAKLANSFDLQPAHAIAA